MWCWPTLATPTHVLSGLRTSSTMQYVRRTPETFGPTPSVADRLISAGPLYSVRTSDVVSGAVVSLPATV